MERGVSVGVIGSGYWGKNLVRTFHSLGALGCICDTSQQALALIQKNYPVRTTLDFDEVLQDDSITAVAIAAPAAEHFALTRRAIEHGKDVFVEKPLALHSSEGRELVALADKKHRILQVGHILEFHPAIRELGERICKGELGQIQYIYSSRLNLGKIRTEENILWSFAPHDISAILFLLRELPVRVSAQGGTYVNPSIIDTTLSTLEFGSGVKAHIFVSWLHPFKEQKLTVVGSEKMAVFDDMQPEQKLMLYSHRINWVDRKPVAQKDSGQAVKIAADEPLRLECQHFLECVAERRTPLTNGESAQRVLEVLENCEQSLRAGGTPVPMQPAKAYFAHPTSIIDEPCEIGPDTKIWHFSHVMVESKIGRGCNLGQNVVISPEVSIGDNVKIQNNVSVYTGVELEDDVFCGPSMVFTNVINPRSHVVRRHEYRKTLVKRGASLGANSTIVCGITIGRYAFVAAGAVVTHDVPDYALVMGTPARQVGWICECGVRLREEGPERQCRCGKRYVIEGSVCQEASFAAQSL